MTDKELKKLHYENRIIRLNRNPVENTNLLRKAKRNLKKLG